MTQDSHSWMTIYQKKCMQVSPGQQHRHVCRSSAGVRMDHPHVHQQDRQMAVQTQRARYSSEGGQTTTTMNAWMVSTGMSPGSILWSDGAAPAEGILDPGSVWNANAGKTSWWGQKSGEVPAGGRGAVLRRTKEVQGLKHSISSGCWLCRQVHFVIILQMYALQVMHFYLCNRHQREVCF